MELASGRSGVGRICVRRLLFFCLAHPPCRNHSLNPFPSLIYVHRSSYSWSPFHAPRLLPKGSYRSHPRGLRSPLSALQEFRRLVPVFTLEQRVNICPLWVVPICVNRLVTRVKAKAYHTPRCAARALKASPLPCKDTPDQPPSPVQVAAPKCGPETRHAGYDL
jgi:hypothetical protein